MKNGLIKYSQKGKTNLVFMENVPLLSYSCQRDWTRLTSTVLGLECYQRNNGI